MDKTIQVLRWLAILPAAILCAVLVMFPIHWIILFLQSGGEDGFITYQNKPLLAAVPTEMLERFGYAFFTPLVMIYIAAQVAPLRRFQAGIAMAVFWGMLFGGGVVFTLINGQYSGWGWLRFAVTCLLGVAGVCVGLFQANEIANKNKPKAFKPSVEASLTDDEIDLLRRNFPEDIVKGNRR